MTLKGELAPLEHGGNLGAARQMFPAAPEPFLDLSTGINPHPYPLPQLPSDALHPPARAGGSRQAHRRRRRGLWRAVAGPCRGGSGLADLVAQTAFLLARGRAAVLAPTYSEHARAAELAGHNVVEVAEVDAARRVPHRHRGQSQQSRRPDRRQGRSARARRSSAPARRPACSSMRPSWMSAHTA